MKDGQQHEFEFSFGATPASPDITNPAEPTAPDSDAPDTSEPGEPDEGQEIGFRAGHAVNPISPSQHPRVERFRFGA